MKNIVVVGTQWGDEGKGKVVDMLSEKADVIVRFQGGHNAGHTLVVDDEEYKLSLLPSGVIRKDKISIIGNGVVVDLMHLFDEIEKLRKRGLAIDRNNLMISENCFLILPIHKYVDNARENKNKSTKIGTTGRGIGPAYEDKVGRRGLRVSDLNDRHSFTKKIKNLYDFHNVWVSFYEKKKIDYEDDMKKIFQIFKKLSPYVSNVSIKLNKFIAEKKNILFEGAQGTFLDIDFGTYPYVTSSNTISGNAAIGSGIGPNNINYVLGITKAYTTRVGNGPFPTEDTGVVGKTLAKKGKEFGTVTGRKRRCGWFDAVMIKQAVLYSGISALALTKLDVLDEFDNINICVNYMIDKRKIDCFPVNENEQNNLQPIYKTFPGWKKTTFGIKSFSDLPIEAKNFIKEIEILVNCKIDLISTGPDREHTIIINNLFYD